MTIFEKQINCQLHSPEELRLQCRKDPSTSGFLLAMEDSVELRGIWTSSLRGMSFPSVVLESGNLEFAVVWYFDTIVKGVHATSTSLPTCLHHSIKLRCVTCADRICTNADDSIYSRWILGSKVLQELLQFKEWLPVCRVFVITGWLTLQCRSCLLHTAHQRQLTQSLKQRADAEPFRGDASLKRFVNFGASNNSGCTRILHKYSLVFKYMHRVME